MTPIQTALNDILAKTYAAMLAFHLAHWNVEGPQFFELHEFFQEQYEDLFAAADLIAERVRALQAYAMPEISRLFEQINAIPPLLDTKNMIKPLRAATQDLVVTLERAVTVATTDGDLKTQNLLLDRITAAEKALWMMRSFNA